MKTGLTVADLIDDPNLGTRLVAGRGGLDRIVLWAHSCELDDPARWLGPHELLMTIGHCVPRSAAEQCEFISRLDAAGIAAIAIGDHQLAPRLSKSMLREAEARSFPVLITTADTPFATLARTVAAAAFDDRTMGVLMLAKLYQVAVNRTQEARRSGHDLGEIVGAGLTVVDEATGCVLVGQGVAVHPNDWSDVVRDDGRRARSHRLRTHRPARLLVRSGDALDAFTLMHLTQILTVDANAIYQEASTRLVSGRTALEQALTGAPGSTTDLARQFDADVLDFRVIVADNQAHERVALGLALSQPNVAVASTAETVTIVTPDSQIQQVRDVLARLGSTAGCSAAHRDLADLTGGVEEAQAEYRHALASGQRWREFVGEQISLLARSRGEAEQICITVLGPLAGDDPKDVALRDTLFAFLDHDQRWSETARALGVHRQSLVYRLNKVEQLTGRNIRRTRDLAEFWLARTAWDRLHSTRHQ